MDQIRLDPQDKLNPPIPRTGLVREIPTPQTHCQQNTPPTGQKSVCGAPTPPRIISETALLKKIPGMRMHALAATGRSLHSIGAAFWKARSWSNVGTVRSWPTAEPSCQAGYYYYCYCHSYIVLPNNVSVHFTVTENVSTTAITVKDKINYLNN